MNSILRKTHLKTTRRHSVRGSRRQFPATLRQFPSQLTGLLLISLLLAACDSQPSQPVLEDGFVLSAPGADSLARAIDATSIEVTVTLDVDNGDGTNSSTTINTSRIGSSSRWQSDPVLVPAGAPFSIEMVWSALDVNGVRVNYARQFQSYPGTNSNLNIDFSALPFSFDEYNIDGGDANNFEELVAGTPPNGPPEPTDTQGSGTTDPEPDPDPVTVPGNPTELAGIWDSPCNTDAAGQTDRNTLSYNPPEFEASGIVYSDTTCTTPRFSQQNSGTYVEGETTDLGGGVTQTEIDYVVDNVTASFFQLTDIVSLNLSATCGISNWTIGVTVDITNCTTLLPGRNFPEANFNVYRMNGGQLFIGPNSEGGTVATRPSEVTTVSYTRR